MTPKLQKALTILVIAIVVFVVGAFAGYTLCKRAQYKGVIKQQKNDAVAVMEHIDKKEEVVKNVDTIIKTKILKVVDPTGCLDTDSPDNYLDGLLSADRAAKSGFN